MGDEYRKINRRRNFWFGLSMLLFGMLLGYWASPAKKGLRVCVNNVNGK